MTTNEIFPDSPVITNPPETPKQIEIRELSGWDLKEILRKAADYVERNQFNFYADVEESVKYSLGYLIKTVETAHENHSKAMDLHYQKLDDTYNSYAAKRKELAEKLENLPKITFPEIPYVNTEGLQRLFDMAEKLSTLTDNQWGRLLELAGALKEK